MKIVIQCAASKDPQAGTMQTDDGTPVIFVAQPDKAPPNRERVYAGPDDACGGTTWRDRLLTYNARPDDNPLDLLPAYRLYRNEAYALLAETFSTDNLFILSAGWGLISASFLTPAYDITFSASADAYKRRGRRDVYNDFCMLHADGKDEVVFFGGKDYLPLFAELTESCEGRCLAYYNSAVAPNMRGIEFIRFKTPTRTNWHYGCVRAFIAGDIGLD